MALDNNSGKATYMGTKCVIIALFLCWSLQPFNLYSAWIDFDPRTVRVNIFIMVVDQAWGQSTQYFGTLVLEYRFCSTRRYSVLVLLKSTCTRTCTQVLLKIKVLLTSTYEYFTSTN